MYLNEIGAAWILETKVIPFVFRHLKYRNVGGKVFNSSKMDGFIKAVKNQISYQHSVEILKIKNNEVKYFKKH